MQRCDFFRQQLFTEGQKASWACRYKLNNYAHYSFIADIQLYADEELTDQPNTAEKYGNKKGPDTGPFSRFYKRLVNKHGTIAQGFPFCNRVRETWLPVVFTPGKQPVYASAVTVPGRILNNLLHGD